MSHPSDAADDPAAAGRDRISVEGRYADLDAGPDDDTDLSPFDPAAIGDRERAEIEDTIFEMRSAAAASFHATGARAAAAVGDAATYTVQSGDTLWAIARANGTDVATLRRLNPDLVPEALAVGAAVRLP